MNGASQPMVDRRTSIVRFRETRRRTADIFDLLTDEAAVPAAYGRPFTTGCQLIWNRPAGPS